MNSTELIKHMQSLASRHKKKIFSLRELEILSGDSAASVGMALLRAKKNGLVDRVRNLWINMMDKPALEELSLELVSPSYISFESALYKHGILSQSPRGVLSLATTAKPAKITTPLGDVQFIHLAPKLFFGFDANRLASPEKAFVDLVYIRIRHGIPELSEVFYLDLLNKKELSSIAAKFPNYVKKALP